MTRTAVVLVSLLGVVGAWVALLVVRCLGRRRIDQSSAGADKKLELEISLDTELLKLGAGAVVIVGLALTAIQAMDARDKAAQDIFTARQEKAYVLLYTQDDGSHVGGVYAMANLDDVDPRGQSDRFRALVIFGKRWSPYTSERTRKCLVPQAILAPYWADSLPPEVSTPINAGMQAVLEAIARVGGVRVLGHLDLAATNLSEASLNGIDLHGAVLARADLSGAALQGADLRGADLFCTNLYRAGMRGVRASDANLPGAFLMNADVGPPLEGNPTEFVHTTLEGADLRNANLCGVNFERALLQHAALDGAVAYGADFRGADLTETTFQNAKLGGASFEGVTMRPDALKPDLTCADLDGGDLSAKTYCEATDVTVRTLAAAVLPDALRTRFTLCRTRIDGKEINRDCQPGQPLPKCQRDTTSSPVSG